METGAELGGTQPTVEGDPKASEAGRGKEGFSPRAIGQSQTWRHLDFRLLPQSSERMLLCCFKPPAGVACYSSPGELMEWPWSSLDSCAVLTHVRVLWGKSPPVPEDPSLL